MRTLSILAAFVVIAVAITVLPSSGTGMPGFARKYSMSCQVCHAPFPKLKPYGFDFIAEGYRLPEGEPVRATVDTGDDLLVLTRDFPIGMRMDLYGTYDHDGTPNNDFTVPYLLKIISGGPITKDISYYFYFFFSERGEVSGIEDALIYVRDLFGSGINLTVGQFAINDPLYKSETRLTREGYTLYRLRPGLSKAALSYDRGIVLDTGFDFGLDLAVMLVNGNGISSAGNAFDMDEYKTGFVRAAQGIGPVSVGGFAYYGVEESRPTLESGLAPGLGAATSGLSSLGGLVAPAKTNEVLYVGGDASLQLEVFELSALFLRRTDSNPRFVAGGLEAVSHGLMVEAVLLPGYDRGRFALVGLYNWFASDVKNEEGADPLAYHSATLNASWLLGRNARLVGEYTWVIKDAERENGHRGSLGVVTAF
jgi:hypothetical protein